MRVSSGQRPRNFGCMDACIFEIPVGRIRVTVLAAPRLKHRQVLSAGRRPVAIVFGRRRQVLRERSLYWREATLRQIKKDTINMKHTLSDMLLFSAQWCSDRDSSGEHGPSATTGSAQVATNVAVQPMLLFQPKYRLGHPENYLFSLFKKIFSGSKYPKNILFNFEKRCTTYNVNTTYSNASLSRTRVEPDFR